MYAYGVAPVYLLPLLLLAIRLNRSLEQELSNLKGSLPASPSSGWGARAPQQIQDARRAATLKSM